MRKNLGKSPAWRPYLLRILDLRRMTAFPADPISQSLGRPIRRPAGAAFSTERSLVIVSGRKLVRRGLSPAFCRFRRCGGCRNSPCRPPAESIIPLAAHFGDPITRRTSFRRLRWSLFFVPAGHCPITVCASLLRPRNDHTVAASRHIMDADPAATLEDKLDPCEFIPP